MEEQNILNFMGNTKPLLLVHKQMQKQTLNAPVNLMLTPQFYTLKREEVPVQYAYQAKRIAPSLFDGLIEEQSHIRYFVSKEEDGWLFIAYDVVQIQDFLEQKGIALENIGKVFFAEQIATTMHSPVKIGEKEALITHDNTVMIVPQSALEEGMSFKKIDDMLTPAKGVVLEGGKGSLLETKDAYILASIFAVFAVMFFVEGARYSGDDNAQQEQIALVLEDHPSLQSSYARKSIAKKYKAIDSKERKKREVINTLSHMIFKGVTLTTFSLNDTKFQAQFSCQDATVVKKLEDLAKKEKFNTTKVANGNAINIGGIL